MLPGDGGDRAIGEGGEAHDVLLGEPVALDLAADQALAHDEHAVAEADQLGQLGRDDDDADAVAGQIAEDAVDLGLGADIDAAGRLIEKDDARVDRQHLGDGDLLLVAARERRHGVVDAAALEAEAVAEPVRLLRLLLGVDRAPRGRDLAEVDRRDIGRDRQIEEDAVALAVLREVDDAVVDAVAVGADAEGAGRRGSPRR